MKKSLIEVALGERKADLVLKNVNLVNVCSGEIHHADIAIYDGRIASLEGHHRGKKEVDGREMYAIPGLIDGHTHIEMSMLSVTEFSKLVVTRGTTSVVEDPHEIANVLGVEGVRLLLEEAKHTPLKLFCMAPSCVPATDFETAGAKIGSKEVKGLLDMDNVIGLGEVMNFTGVLSGDKDLLAKIEEARGRGLPVDGHAPSVTGKELDAYISAGIGSDHESITGKEALEKLRRGMYLMVREGSAARNLGNIAPVLKMLKEKRRCILVTDGDILTKDMREKGYLDHVLRRAIEEGIDPVEAVQMCTINTAECFHLFDIGCISPGKIADIVLLESLEKFEVREVIVDGKPLDERIKEMRTFVYPESARKTVRLRDRIKEEDLLIPRKRMKARIIGIIDGEILTKEMIEEISGVEVERDILKIAVVERHKRTGNIGIGFVKGFGLKRGAVASSIAHDSHNIIVIGTNDGDMAFACNRLEEIGGGIVLCDGGKVISELALPIAGLMSDRDAEYVIDKTGELHDRISELGCDLNSPFITMSFLALPVIPELKLTDKGLVKDFRFVELAVTE